eukprot:10155302-Alexandrium_andersonii.AAC.1
MYLGRLSLSSYLQACPLPLRTRSEAWQVRPSRPHEILYWPMVSMFVTATCVPGTAYRLVGSEWSWGASGLNRGGMLG